MKNLVKLGLLLTAVLLQVGCASITGSRNQPLSVATVHEGKPIIGAACTLTNDKGTYYVTTPGTVTIQKAYGDLSATCKKEETHVGVAVFSSSSEGATWGNILAGGLIGYAVDASTGAGFSYSPTLTISMVKGNVMPPMPTITQADSKSSETSSESLTNAAPGVIYETQSSGATSPGPARSSIMPSPNSMAVNNSPNPAKKLEDLNTMLKKGFITQDDYNTKKTEILKNM